MLTPLIEEFHSSKSPWEVFCALDAGAGHSFFLDSVRYRPPDQNYSYLGRDPFLEVVLKRGMIEVRGEECLKVPSSRIFSFLRQLFAKYRVPRNDRIDFFTGGAVGFWSYEAAELFERIRFRRKSCEKASDDLPLLHLGFYRDLIVYDHCKEVYYLVSHYATLTN